MLYKKDDPRNPLNYRGIGLLNIIAKVFSSILQKRWVKFEKQMHILEDEQGGFRADRGTDDQLYITVETIYLKQPQTIYCCFLDLSKAYDTVWRAGLWMKLWEVGVTGKYWRVLKNMYKNTRRSVIVGEKKTIFFGVELGLWQGDPFSPDLFNVYIDGLVKKIKRSCISIDVETIKLAILLYADDEILFADTPNKLLALMKIAAQYGT